MTMASTKKEVIERYQKYNVSDYEVVDKVIDSADKDSEIIKKFDEIDSLSEEIGEKTISALSDYYDGIASFIKDLDKAVAKAKEEMTKRGVDKETVEKLDKLTEVSS